MSGKTAQELYEEWTKKLDNHDDACSGLAARDIYAYQAQELSFGISVQVFLKYALGRMAEMEQEITALKSNSKGDEQ